MSWRNPINWSSANMLVVMTDIAGRVVPPAAAPSLLATAIQPSRGGYYCEPLFDGNWNRFPEQTFSGGEKTDPDPSIVKT